jgi:hypothetical protein
MTPYLRNAAYVMSSNCPMTPSLGLSRRSIGIACAAISVPRLLCNHSATRREGTHHEMQGFFVNAEGCPANTTFGVSRSRQAK